MCRRKNENGDKGTSGMNCEDQFYTINYSLNKLGNEAPASTLAFLTGANWIALITS